MIRNYYYCVLCLNEYNKENATNVSANDVRNNNDDENNDANY